MSSVFFFTSFFSISRPHFFSHSFECWRCEQTKIYMFKLLFVINFHWKLKHTHKFYTNKKKTIINGHSWKTEHRYFLSWPGSKWTRERHQLAGRVSKFCCCCFFFILLYSSGIAICVILWRRYNVKGEHRHHKIYYAHSSQHVLGRFFFSFSSSLNQLLYYFTMMPTGEPAWSQSIAIVSTR